MQLVHTDAMPIARAGMIADSGLVQDVISRSAENTTGARAGTLVVPGTLPESQAVAPTATGQVSDGDALGVVMFDASKEPARGATAITAGNEYDRYDTLPIVQKGRVWVLCDATATITANTPAFVRFTAGVGEVLGAFRQDADGGDAVGLPNAVFRSAHYDVNFDQAGTQRIALLEINLPVTT